MIYWLGCRSKFIRQLVRKIPFLNKRITWGIQGFIIDNPEYIKNNEPSFLNNRVLESFLNDGVLLEVGKWKAERINVPIKF
mgnify:CR=1 FL=1